MQQQTPRFFWDHHGLLVNLEVASSNGAVEINHFSDASTRIIVFPIFSTSRSESISEIGCVAIEKLEHDDHKRSTRIVEYYDGCAFQLRSVQIYVVVRS